MANKVIVPDIGDFENEFSNLVDQERFELSTSPSVAVRSTQLKLLVHYEINIL